jgi:hypothetical protein
MNDYIDLLKSHDWYYSYSDDHRVWKDGELKARQLQELQQAHDPDFSVWNQYAPQDCKREVSNG